MIGIILIYVAVIILIDNQYCKDTDHNDMHLKYLYSCNINKEKVLYLIEPLNLIKKTFILVAYFMLEEVYMF